MLAVAGAQIQSAEFKGKIDWQNIRKQPHC